MVNSHPLSSVDQSLGMNSAGLQAMLDSGSRFNPPADPRLHSHPWMRGLLRGRMQQTSDYVQSLVQGLALNGGVNQRLKNLGAKRGARPYGVNFVYNPSQVSVSYGIDSSVLPSNQLTPAQLAANAVYPGMTSLSFSLLFDRTYECGGMDDLSAVGAYIDIGAFERMVGAMDPDTGQYSNMKMVPVVVVFGGGKKDTAAAGQTGLSYVGFINSASVTYGHFTESMVPMRAELDVTMTLLIGANVKQALDPANRTALTIADTTYADAANGTDTTAK